MDGSKYYKNLELNRTEIAILLEDNIWVEGQERPLAKITIPVLFPLFDVNNIVENKIAKDGVVLDASNYVEAKIPAYLYPDYTTLADGTKIRKIEKGFHFIVCFVSGKTTKIRIIAPFDYYDYKNKWDGGGGGTPIPFNIVDLDPLMRDLTELDYMAVQDNSEENPSKISLNTLSEYLEETLEITAKVPQDVLDHIDNNTDLINIHKRDTDVHVNTEEKFKWNNADENVIEKVKVDGSLLSIDDKTVNIVGLAASNEHIEDVSIHASKDEKAQWNSSQPNVIESVSVDGEVLTITDKNVNIVGLAASNEHIEDTSIHASTEEKTQWNLAQPNVIETITLDGVELPINNKTVNVSSSTEVLSVKSAGCVGDGVTDDTANFQAALAQACELGQILYIDKGTYLITDRLIVTDTVSIMGANQKESIIKYNGTYVEETAYDLDYYEESNACFIVRADNSEISNLTIVGGESKDTASASNGIIFHYTKPNQTQYDAAQRVAITNVDIKYFKNAMFLYAGWNRYITRCNFVDCTQNGVKYYPLEIATVGEWAASGDVFIACQFIGNLVGGFNAYAAFETTIWNSVFEYNERAIITNNCRDVCFKNCWNEANNDTLYIKGSCKFEGGYNINNGTVTHELIGGNDLIQFEAENLITMCRLGQIIFNQSSGIITKGVELGSEIENLVQNPYFEEASGGTSTIPSTQGWDVYPSWATTVVEDSPNYVTVSVADQTSDVYYGLWASYIAVEPTQKYAASAWIKVDSRASLDSDGVMCFIAWKNSNGETIVIDNRSVTMIGDNIWELKEWALTAPNQATTLIIGWGLARNGKMHLREPQVNYDDGATRSNVLVRLSNEDPNTVRFLNSSGTELGAIDLDNVNKINYSETEQVIGSWIDGKALYQKTISFGLLPNATTISIAHSISDVDNIWITNGFVKDDTSSYQLSNNEWTFYVDNTNINCTTTTDKSTCTAYLNIQYTKTV